MSKSYALSDAGNPTFVQHQRPWMDVPIVGYADIVCGERFLLFSQ